MISRDEQKRATRAHILDAATNLLVQRGYSALTTVAVQNAAGVSRGALLHHFPTSQELIAAMVAHLVRLNESATEVAAERIGATADPVNRTLAALYESMTRPAAHAEFELWAAARTDPELASVLREAERRAGRDLLRVVDGLFGVEISGHPRYPAIRDLTIGVLRGIAITQVLRPSRNAIETTLANWADALTTLLGSAESTAGSVGRKALASTVSVRRCPTCGSSAIAGRVD